MLVLPHIARDPHRNARQLSPRILGEASSSAEDLSNRARAPGETSRGCRLGGDVARHERDTCTYTCTYTYSYTYTYTYTYTFTYTYTYTCTCTYTYTCTCTYTYAYSYTYTYTYTYNYTGAFFLASLRTLAGDVPVRNDPGS